MNTKSNSTITWSETTNKQIKQASDMSTRYNFRIKSIKPTKRSISIVEKINDQSTNIHNESMKLERSKVRFSNFKNSLITSIMNSKLLESSSKYVNLDNSRSTSYKDKHLSGNVKNDEAKSGFLCRKSIFFPQH